VDVETATPEFIRWSLGYECAPRLACRGDEPEHVERQLKALRAVGDALAARRELDGICFEPALDVPPGPGRPPRGFRASEVLQAYGVDSLASLPCGNCVAHVDRRLGSSTLAGCFGLVDWSEVAEPLARVLPELVDQVASPEQLRQEFLVTNPPWNGLWVDSPLKPRQLPILRDLLNRLVALGDAWRAVFERLRCAVESALEFQLSLHVAYSPAGHLSGRHWIVGTHCSRCKSSRPPASRVCPACGLDARPEPTRKRLGRGSRPYWPLADFLGPPARRDLLRRYLVNRNWDSNQIDRCLLEVDSTREAKVPADDRPT
jgi:hypothetical protein